MAVDLDAVRQRLLTMVQPCAAEHVPLENCWWRILAQDITAICDYPPFDRALMDGYAVRLRDVAAASPKNPVVLRQIDDIPAGSVAKGYIGPGETARIMTGAALPPGADGVVKLEDTVQDGPNIYIMTGAKANRHVNRQGEDIRAGDLVLRRGRTVDTGAMGLLAMQGVHAPQVCRRPRVGILVTGSEVIGVEEKLIPGKIWNSNSYMLLAQIKEAGGEPVLLGKVPDETKQIAEMLWKAPPCELLITTGGLATGDYDLMAEVFAALKVSLLFDRAAMEPGPSVLAGRWRDSLLLALSGNPGAASVAFEAVVRPLIRKLAGYALLERPAVKAVLQKK